MSPDQIKRMRFATDASRDAFEFSPRLRLANLAAARARCSALRRRWGDDRAARRRLAAAGLSLGPMGLRGAGVLRWLEKRCPNAARWL
jgi:hypothetical protein